MPLTVTSTAFAQGEPIPQKFTCAGSDIAPPLAWAGAPKSVKAWALILDDPDAPGGTWTHWTFWNLPAGARSIPEGADLKAMGATEGITSAGTMGYHGPCPPSGTHRYSVKVYALSQPLSLSEGAKVQQLRSAMTGRILAEGQLMGTFSK
ncbi:MAG: YbhB/YbcL family Raf kinase inhibitor-like protein [Thermoplasmatota archaeon]